MQTTFSLAQLADPDIEAANSILRSCVHCGMCTATCPTFVLLGDELDSPRGRIYLIKDMLENDRPATAKVALHIDRCLSCLSCMTTCPSGVHYMHLVDQARHRIEETLRRPFADRWMRALLARLLPSPFLFRLALTGAMVAKPFAPLAGGLLQGRVRAMLDLAPSTVRPPSWMDRPQVFPACGARTARVALLTGCAQRVLAPEINEATIRLLTRHGVEVVVTRGTGCCGSATHHMGKTELALRSVRANVDAWTDEATRRGLDAIVVNSSGCGTTMKDYGWMLRTDPAYAEKAAFISSLTRDIAEFLPRTRAAPAGQRRGTCRHLPFGVLDAARTADRTRTGRTAGTGRVPGDGAAGEAPVLRGRRAPTTSFSPALPPGCGTASSATSPPPLPTSSPPATSAASPSWPTRATFRWSIPPNCSTGRPEVLNPGRCRPAPRHRPRHTGKCSARLPGRRAVPIRPGPRTGPNEPGTGPARRAAVGNTSLDSGETGELTEPVLRREQGSTPPMPWPEAGRGDYSRSCPKGRSGR